MLAQFALHAVELIAVVHGHAGGELPRIARRAVRVHRGMVALLGTAVLLRLVGDDDDPAHAFGVHLLRDRRHGQLAVGRLAAGHCHRIVEQDLVGDRHVGGHRGADRERAGVEVGAVAEIGEDVLFVRERRLADPRRAFATHLRRGRRVAVHPDRHVVAADAGGCARTLGHHGRRVVRAAGAEIRRSLGDQPWPRQSFLLRFDDRQPRLNPGAHVGRQFQPADARGNRLGDDHRRELVLGRQHPAALRHRPFAAVLLVELADHARHAPAGADPGEQVFLDLVLDQLPLFLDDEDLFEPFGEGTHGLRLERPDHADLEHADADAGTGLLVEAEVGQRLAHVQIRFATGDDAEARVRRVDHRLVEPVGAAVGERGVQLVVEQSCFLRQWRVGPADVQPPGRHHEVGRQIDLHALGVDDHRRRGFDHFGHRLQRHPHARIAAHRQAVQAEVEVLLHGGRIQHRDHAGLEDVVRLVRQRRTLRTVIVAGQREYAAVRARPGGIGVLEHVAAAIHPRSLAVPHAEDAVVPCASEHVDLLRSPHAGGGEVFVQSRVEPDVMLFEVFLRAPRGLVDRAKGAASVAGNESRGVQAGDRVALPLQHRQSQQRLRAAHVGASAFERPAVVEGDFGQSAPDGFGQRGVHRDASSLCSKRSLLRRLGGLMRDSSAKNRVPGSASPITSHHRARPRFASWASAAVSGLQETPRRRRD